MTPEKIIAVVAAYEERLRKAGIPVTRMDVMKTFLDLSIEERLAHAHYLCRSVRELVEAGEAGRARRHLSAVQMSLSFAGWLTLRQMMDDLRPDGADFDPMR